jgi:hypothetical protein
MGAVIGVAAINDISSKVASEDATPSGGEAAVPSNDEIVDAVEKSGATVTPHQTKTGEGVTIQFPGGAVIDVRVEDHPLEKGGPSVPHANVEAWKADGSRVQNKHILP